MSSLAALPPSLAPTADPSATSAAKPSSDGGTFDDIFAAQSPTPTADPATTAPPVGTAHGQADSNTAPSDTADLALGTGLTSDQSSGTTVPGGTPASGQTDPGATVALFPSVADRVALRAHSDARTHSSARPTAEADTTSHGGVDQSAQTSSGSAASPLLISSAIVDTSPDHDSPAHGAGATAKDVAASSWVSAPAGPTVAVTTQDEGVPKHVAASMVDQKGIAAAPSAAFRAPRRQLRRHRTREPQATDQPVMGPRAAPGTTQPRSARSAHTVGCGAERTRRQRGRHQPHDREDVHCPRRQRDRQRRWPATQRCCGSYVGGVTLWCAYPGRQRTDVA